MSHRTFVYVDGFNLYYRALKHRPRYKWLNVVALCQSLLIAENKIECLRYYTADISGKRDPEAPKRQKLYLDALRTLPEVEIHKGNFLSNIKKARLAAHPHSVVEVLHTEEKGSDVNLACHMLTDGFRDLYDVAVVVSNDTDLLEPIRIVKQELQKPVGIICPTEMAASSLKGMATFVRHISQQRLRDAQFPDPIPGTDLRRPPTW